MSDEARRLLERLTTDEAMSYPVDHGNPPDPPTVGNALHCDYCDANVDSDGPHKDDCPWAEARAFLAQPEPAAREAVLVEELTKQRDHWRAALTAWKGNETIDIAYASALAMESDLTRILTDTSPATPGGRTRAAALLAQKERMREALERYAQGHRTPELARAALVPGEEKE